MYKNKEWLKNEYKSKTAEEIANECKTNKSTILRWLKKFNIPIRHGKEARLGRTIIRDGINYDAPYRNKEWLENEYKSKTVQQIANETGITKQSLLKWFKKFNIPRRSNGDSHSKLKNKYYFDKIDSSIKAYWLGFLMADGTNSNNTIEMGLAIKDKNHILQFKKDIGWEGKIHDIWNQCGVSGYDTYHEECHIGIHSEHLSNIMKKWGIIENKTGKETFPDIKKEYYKDFIRGYFDGDGCYTYHYKKNHLQHSIKIVCMNKEFLETIKTVLITDANINIDKIHIYKAKNIWSLEISEMKSVLKFYEYIYPKYCRRFLVRKRNKFKETLPYIKSHIK